MSIIRPSSPISGIKRLGAAADQPAAALPAAAPVAREARRAELEAAFAEELSELRAAARREGLLTAEAEIEAVVVQREAALATASQEAEAARDAEHAAAVAALRETTAALPAQLARLREEASAAALEVAFQAVLRLLGERQADRNLMAALVTQAVREHRLSGRVIVRLAPALAATLADLSLPGVDLGIEEDATLAPGDCRLVFGAGQVEADLAAQLDRLRDAFLAALEA